MLVVDDHPDVAKAVCRLLALDCEVLGSVADGTALLETAERLRPDVVVLDVNLPNFQGLDLCRQVMHAHPEMRVIVFTAMDDPDVRERSFAAGAAAFVPKLPHGDLRSTIKRLCVERG